MAEEETGLPLRVAFAGLWTVADREGRFRWEPEELKLDCLPFDKVDFSRVLDALATRGFLIKYASQGREFGWIPGFCEHQVVNNREAPSKLPDPRESATITIDCTRAARVDDASSTRHDPAQVEGKGKEGKGREAREGALVEFETWYAGYPLKKGRGQAEKAFLAARKTADLDVLTAGRDRYAAEVAGADPKFTKHPATWLNGRCWLDEPTKPHVNGHANGKLRHMSVAEKVEKRTAEEARLGRRMTPMEDRQFFMAMGVNPHDD